MILRALPPAFYARPTDRVARSLLGQVLVSEIGGRRTVGRIVETEAYLGPRDPASHAWKGRRSPAVESLYGPAGIAYVYFTYGMHWCLNAVTRRPGVPAAVLIRALEPLEGIPVMRRRRGGGIPEGRLCRGPAMLCQALGITGRQDGASLARGPLRILRDPAHRRHRVAIGSRIGITRAEDWPLRFWIADSPWVSR